MQDVPLPKTVRLCGHSQVTMTYCNQEFLITVAFVKTDNEETSLLQHTGHHVFNHRKSPSGIPSCFHRRSYVKRVLF